MEGRMLFADALRQEGTRNTKGSALVIDYCHGIIPKQILKAQTEVTKSIEHQDKMMDKAEDQRHRDCCATLEILKGSRQHHDRIFHEASESSQIIIASIKAAPLKALYGRKCRSPVLLDELDKFKTHVFNTRRQQIKETYHVTFDESMEAIKFTITSVNKIGTDDSSRYPPNKFLQEDDPSDNINQILIFHTISFLMDRWSRDQYIEIVNIVGDPGEGMLTRMPLDLSKDTKPYIKLRSSRSVHWDQQVVSELVVKL
ncbi:hypothetical protein Tco_0534818 [Tanacetum coccineum]